MFVKPQSRKTRCTGHAESTREELFVRPVDSVDSWGPKSVILAQADPQKVAQLVYFEAASRKVCVFTWD